MSKVDTFRRRTWKAPLTASQARAARSDVEADLLEYERSRDDIDDGAYCDGCDYCDPSREDWRAWREAQGGR